MKAFTVLEFDNPQGVARRHREFMKVAFAVRSVNRSDP